jgi:predicted DCC family thiol-disulfide oxidoreductase YuxK
VRLVQALDRRHRVTMVPFQKPGAPAAHGLSLAQCRDAAWAVTPARQRYPGAAATNMALAVALGTRLPLWLYAIPGLRQLQDAAYAWVVRNRGRLPGVTPYCEQHPEECGS